MNLYFFLLGRSSVVSQKRACLMAFCTRSSWCWMWWVGGSARARSWGGSPEIILLLVNQRAWRTPGTQTDTDRGWMRGQTCLWGIIWTIFTFQCTCSLVVNIAWFLFVKRHLMKRRGPVEPRVLVVPLPPFISRFCESGHIVHLFFVGNHVEAGDLHSLPRFLWLWGILSWHTATDPEAPPRQPTAGCSMRVQAFHNRGGHRTRQQWSGHH